MYGLSLEMRGLGVGLEGSGVLFTKGRKRLSVVRMFVRHSYELDRYSRKKSFVRSVANSFVNLRHT